MKALSLTLLLAASLSMTGSLAVAQASAPGTAIERIAILPGWREPDGTRMAGLGIWLAPGWKTYWRAPGEAGIPPRLDWAGSANAVSLQMHWPSPQVFDTNGFRTIGYAEHVVLPLSIVPRDADQPVRIEAEAHLGVCREVCLPVSVALDATLDGDGGAADRAMIQAALNARPKPARVDGVVCMVEPISDGLRLHMAATMPSQGSPETAVLEFDSAGIWVSDTATHRKNGTLHATADLVPPDAAPFGLDRSAVRMTVIAGGSAVEIAGCTGRSN